MQDIIDEMLDFKTVTKHNIKWSGDMYIECYHLSRNLFSKLSNLIYEVILTIFNKWSI